DGRAEREVETPASSLDGDIAGQSSEPWHLSGELTRQEQETSQNYHHGPETEKDFAQIGHGDAARSAIAPARWTGSEWPDQDARTRAATPGAGGAGAPRSRSGAGRAPPPPRAFPTRR